MTRRRTHGSKRQVLYCRIVVDTDPDAKIVIARLNHLGQWPCVGIVEVKCVRDAGICALG